MATCAVKPKVMTRWSRHDAALLTRSNSDHWAKMRTRPSMSAGGMTREPTFLVKDIGSSLRTEKEKRLSNNMSSSDAPAAHMGDGRADPVANAIASRVSMHDLHGNVPGNYASPNYAVYTSQGNQQRSASMSRSAGQRNEYQLRAKQGFEFWYKERPKPTTFGRYGIGSYKTLLGLGNAPRT